MTGFQKAAYHLSYKLRSHQWSGWPLDYWVLLGIVLLAGVVSLGWIPGSPWLVYLLAVLAVAFWVLTYLAKRNQYVVFSPDAGPRAPVETPALQPTDKIELNATGRFEVEGKEQTFTEIAAYFRTFATREHVVMAIIPPSRFLLLGSRPDGQEGMWYIFFRQQHICSLESGTLSFGAQDRPALRVACSREEGDETVFLSFNDEGGRRRVLADLQMDGEPRET